MASSRLSSPARIDSRSTSDRSCSVSSPRSRRATLIPSGSGNPVSSSHHSPRSIDFSRPSDGYVSCPSWMSRPASARPSRTSSRILSKGRTRNGNVPRQSRSVRNAVVSSPGTTISVSRNSSGDSTRGTETVVPGELTTAFLTLRLCLGTFPFRVLPFARILGAVREGRAEAGLLIHEGQLTYPSLGLEKAIDLGEWWLLETGLPLPLGINVARRDLGDETLHDLSEVLRESIRAGLENREEAMRYAMQFGRGLDERLADRFVGMYVNELTEDYGDEGRKAVQELLGRAEAMGLYERPVELSFVA